MDDLSGKDLALALLVGIPAGALVFFLVLLMQL